MTKASPDEVLLGVFSSVYSDSVSIPRVGTLRTSVCVCVCVCVHAHSSGWKKPYKAGIVEETSSSKRNIPNGLHFEEKILFSLIFLGVDVLIMYVDLFKNQSRASLVAQWLGVCLLMQGTRVRALVWEDPTCRGAAGPVSHNC